MEHAWNWDAKTLERAARVWGARLGLKDRDSYEGLSWVTRAVSSELGRRVAKSGNVYREAPAAFIEDGVLREGVMDLLFEEDGEWVLVDFKTDASLQERSAAYEDQVRFYSRLLEKTTRLPIKQALLWFVRSDQVVSVDLTRLK
jgi:ATP-dependent exoDNAse (exonuclease V) beta subunit